MATLLITNNTSEPVLVQELYASVPASGELSTSRSAADVQGMTSFLESVAAGDLSYTLSQDNAADIGAEGSESQKFLGTPAATDVAGIHAALAGNAASDDFPGAFTNPDVPRNVDAVFALNYDGGDITLTGTDQFGAAQTEVIAAAANSTVAGVKIFVTVTAATKAGGGSDAATVSLGNGAVLGVGCRLGAATGNLIFADGVGEAGVWDATNNSVDPTTAPDGSVEFIVLAKLG